jgi:hypothetical protein
MRCFSMLPLGTSFAAEAQDGFVELVKRNIVRAELNREAYAILQSSQGVLRLCQVDLFALRNLTMGLENS